MLQLDVYAEKMVQNVRCLLAVEPDKKVIGNDFNAGELIYTLACTYENCYDRFSSQERKQIESIIMDVLSLYYKSHILENEETHIFDNHFWQFAFRHFMQAALVMYGKYPLAKEYLEYSYELWTARAPPPVSTATVHGITEQVISAPMPLPYLMCPPCSAI